MKEHREVEAAIAKEEARKRKQAELEKGSEDSEAESVEGDAKGKTEEHKKSRDQNMTLNSDLKEIKVSAKGSAIDAASSKASGRGGGGKISMDSLTVRSMKNAQPSSDNNMKSAINLEDVDAS